MREIIKRLDRLEDVKVLPLMLDRNLVAVDQHHKGKQYTEAQMEQYAGPVVIIDL